MPGTKSNPPERLWQEGIAGADFFIAAIGSAIEGFGKDKKVMDKVGHRADPTRAGAVARPTALITVARCFGGHGGLPC
ncbi:MAG: hypothetical protein JRI41_02355 [Deltaproteobacteria bacterium]|nr:hypothetical protein [Deltaproteobacteria bacterium]